jgi:hypothetical protein
MKRLLLASVLLLMTAAGSAYGQALTGDYVIGTGQTYTSLAAAIAALNTNGASGTVRFLINEDLTETGANLVITRSDLSATDNLVIKPNSGKTPKITISGCASASGASQYTGLTLDDADYVTIDGSNTVGGTTRDLTIALNDATNGRNGIKLNGNTDNITIKNVKLTAEAIVATTNTNTYTYGIYALGGTTAGNVSDSLLMENNQVGTSSASFAFAINVSNGSGGATYSTALTITGNALYAQVRVLNLLWANGSGSTLQVSDNRLSLLGNGAGFLHAGIYLQEFYSTVNVCRNRFLELKMANSSVSANTLFGIHTLSGNSSAALNIYNNLFADFYLSGTNTGNSITGINANAGNTVHNIFYNTVYLNGDNYNGNTGTFASLTVGAGTGNSVNAKNNILVNTIDASTAFAVYVDGTSAFTSSDYNDLFVSGASAYVGYYNPNPKQSLADWKTASGKDANSISVNPANPFGGAGQLDSLKGLHWVSKPNEVFAATPLGAPYTTDIDGDARDATYPYMGADEIPGQPLPVQMVSFTLASAGHSAVLSWTTATEVNNYGFEIERRSLAGGQAFLSVPQDSWLKIGFVPGAGTSTSVRNYRYVDEGVASGRYAYRVKQINTDGTFAYVAEGELVVGAVPSTLMLEQNYPNPFNPTTTIRFYLPTSTQVWLTIYNATGEEVGALMKGDALSEGYHEVGFDARTAGSGAYFAVLRTPHATLTKRMLLVK